MPRHSRSLPDRAWSVDEGDDWEIERVANATNRRPSGTPECRVCPPAPWLIGENADGSTVESCEAGDEIRRPTGADFEEVTVVADVADHVADVVTSGGRRRNSIASLRSRTLGDVIGDDVGRFDVGVVGQVRQKLFRRRRWRTPDREPRAMRLRCGARGPRLLRVRRCRSPLR